MKPYLLSITILLSLLTSSTAFARELPRGSKSIGGQSSYFNYGETESENGDTTTGYSLGLDMGYFMAQNFELGLGFTYSQTESDTGAYTSRSKRYSIGPFITKHFPVSKMNNIILTGGFNYIKRTNSSGNDSSLKSWQVGAGVMHFFTPTVGTSITFNHLETKDAEGSYREYTQTYVDIGLKLFF